MTYNNGWIKLHRKLLESPISSKPNYISVWVFLLLNANHKESQALINKENFTVEEGAMITSISKIAKKFDLSTGTVSYILDYFISENMIEKQSNGNFTYIKIKNWDKFQKTESSIEKGGANSESNFESSNPSENGGVVESNVENEMKANKKRNENEMKHINNNKNIKKNKNEKKNNMQAELANLSDGEKVNKLISKMKKQLNPNLEYNNKTQRKALEDLIEKFGAEKIAKTIDYATTVFGEKYAPTITTPLQLKKKMAQLVSYKQKSSNSSNSIVI